ncbi:hypothetical protein L9F63_007628, partial [Diploptera punctata]
PDRLSTVTISHLTFVSPSGVGENAVGCFRLFSRLRILIFFTFLPRESGKIFFSLGSRGICFGCFRLFSHWRIPIFFTFPILLIFHPRELWKYCAMFSPLLPFLPRKSGKM